MGFGLGALSSRSGMLGKLLSKGNTVDNPSENEEEIPEIAAGSPLPGAPKELPQRAGKLYEMGNTDPTAHDDDNENSDTDPVVTKPEVLAHLPRTFSPSPETPYPSHDEADDLGSQHELPYGGGGEGVTATTSTAPSALDTARGKLAKFDTPLTGKQRLLRAIVQAAPIVAGGLVGATDNGVERNINEANAQRQHTRAGLEQDVTREEAAQEKGREFDSRQAATQLGRDQLAEYRKTTHEERMMKAASMTKPVNGRVMQYNPTTGAYDKDLGPVTVTKKPIHLMKEGSKTIGATDEEGQSWSNDDPNLPENLKGILTRATAQDATNQAQAQATADEHFKHQLDLQARSAEASALRQRAGFEHQDETHAMKIKADQAMKEANLTMAERAFSDPNPNNRAINDNTLVMEYIRHTLPNGSRMTNTELQAAWQARKLPDYALNYLDVHFNHQLTPMQRTAMIGSVRTAVASTREAAENAAAVYGGGGADGGRQFQGGATTPQGGGGGAAGDISVVAPNGKTYKFPNAAAAAAFKKNAGIP